MLSLLRVLLLWGIYSSTLFGNNSSIAFYFTKQILDYKEYDKTGALLDSEGSDFRDIIGWKLQYTYTYYTHGIFFKPQISYRYQQGESDYVGAILGSDAGYGSYTSTTYNIMNEAELMLKVLYPVSSLLHLKGGVSIGTHQWERQLSSAQIETYKWYPLGVVGGMVFKTSSASKLHYNFEIFYKKGISPTMDDTHTNETFDLGDEEDYGFLVGIVYQINHFFDCFINYKYNKQSISKSNLVPFEGKYYYEPDSKDTKRFIEVGLGYNF